MFVFLCVEKIQHCEKTGVLYAFFEDEVHYAIASYQEGSYQIEYNVLYTLTYYEHNYMHVQRCVFA